MRKLSVAEIRTKIQAEWPDDWRAREKGPTVYGVPRGGWNIAFMLDRMELAVQVNTPEEAEVIVDDVIDGGETRKKWEGLYPGKDFWAPYDKILNPLLPWLVFPWEGERDLDAEDTVRRILQLIGENPKREGLLDTPKRVVKSWKELFAGYSQKPEEILSRVFTSDSDEMVICKDIEFYSMCEHHMIPFYGKASIGYLPKGKVVGLSKLARLVDCFARRLQIQEQLTSQIAKAIKEHVPGALGVGVVVQAKHLCMCGRGVGKQGSSMVTSAMLGKFREDPAVRAEFLELTKRG